MDILFNTSSINSDNLKLSLLYTMDCYFNTALTSSSYTYTRYKNTENANTFVKCFQGYTTFQIYANNIAKSYISGVTSGGALNRALLISFTVRALKMRKAGKISAMARSIFAEVSWMYWQNFISSTIVFT